jgi:hypothetical protein
MGDAEKAAGMQRGRPFKPGQSGNPAGKGLRTNYRIEFRHVDREFSPLGV